jgi:hypothetical protein
MAADAQPDVKPGLWETTTTTTMLSDQFNMPPMTQTTTECVTAEDIDKGQAFLEDNDSCEVIEKEVREDGMDVSMSCDQGEGGSITMNSSMTFDGDSMNGIITGTMQGPMGDMDMKIELSGKRLGDC